MNRVINLPINIIQSPTGPKKVTSVLFYELDNEMSVNLEITVNDKIILGEDWNLVFNKDLDRMGGMDKIDSLPVSFGQLRETHNIQRIDHTDTKRFTYRRKRVQSRLDYFFVSSSMQGIAHNSDIVPSIFCLTLQQFYCM